MNKIQKAAANMLLNYLADNPMEKLPKMFEVAEKLDRGNLHATQIKVMREILLDENNIWHTFVKNLVQEVDTKLLQKFVECFIINANLEGEERARAIEKKYDCNIPWAILMDPTSACNLSCTGSGLHSTEIKTICPMRRLILFVVKVRKWAFISIYSQAVSHLYARRILFDCVKRIRIVISLHLRTERLWMTNCAETCWRWAILH